MNKLLLKIIGLYILSVIYCITLEAQWSKPISLTDNMPGGPIKPMVEAIKKGNQNFVWIQSYDLQGYNNSICYREIIDNKLSAIKILSNNGFVRSDPKILRLGDKRHIIIWREQVMNSEDSSSTDSTDYYYVIKNGEKWTESKAFFRCFTLGDYIAKSSNKRAHVIILSNHIYYLNFEDSVWSSPGYIPTDIMPIDFLLTDDDEILFAGILPKGEITYDVNSVQVAHSYNGRQNWTLPQLVQKSGIYPASDIKICKDSKTGYHLIWKKSIHSTMWGGVLYHSYSVDGVDWSLPKIITVEADDDVSDINVVPVNGILNIIWMGQPSETPYSIKYMQLNSSVESTPVILFEKALYPFLAKDSIGAMHLVYMKMKDGDQSSALLYHYLENSSNEVEKLSSLPDDFELYQNYPNPFNPMTRIKFYQPQQGHVKLKIYDVTGREVQTLIDNVLQAGYHTLNWKPTNQPSGIYFYTVSTKYNTYSKKMIYLK